MKNRFLSTVLAASLLASTAMAQSSSPTQAPHAPLSRAQALNAALLNQTVKVIAPGGVGSGTVLAVHGLSGRSLNIVLTNAHVVESLKKACAIEIASEKNDRECSSGIPTIEVRAWIEKNGKTYPVTYQGRAMMAAINPKIDLAVILLDENWPGSTAEVLPEGEHVEQSEDVFAVGSPIGERTQITKGNVTLTDNSRGDFLTMGITAPIFPGNSGGGAYVERDGKFYFVGVPSAVANVNGVPAFEHGIIIPLNIVKSYLSSFDLNF